MPLSEKWRGSQPLYFSVPSIIFNVCSDKMGLFEDKQETGTHMDGGGGCSSSCPHAEFLQNPPGPSQHRQAGLALPTLSACSTAWLVPFLISSTPSCSEHPSFLLISRQLVLGPFPSLFSKVLSKQVDPPH